MSKPVFYDKKYNTENHFKSLEDFQNYKQNQMQIDCISRVLIEHADVPKELIDWLIKSVKENTTLECKIIKYKEDIN